MHGFVSRSLMASAALSLIITVVPRDGSAAGQHANPDRAIQGSVVVLCASAGTSAAQLTHTRVVVSRRVKHGFGFSKASVRITGSDCSRDCCHTIRWLQWLAQDISGVGRLWRRCGVPRRGSEVNHR